MEKYIRDYVNMQNYWFTCTGQGATNTMRVRKYKMSSVYIFPVLFFIICLSYLIRFIFFNIETEIVKYESIENVIHTMTMIVRNESATIGSLTVE